MRRVLTIIAVFLILLAVLGTGGAAFTTLLNALHANISAAVPAIGYIDGIVIFVTAVLTVAVAVGGVVLTWRWWDLLGEED